MGRTKRKRRRKSISTVKMIDGNLINLHKWLKENNWHNHNKLIIKQFLDTGRGITSTKAIHKSETLIEVPYDLMITFTTIQTYLTECKITLNEKLTIHELLALFLVLERNNESSSWKRYINTLPSQVPDLPWLRPTEEINLYPSDLRIASIKNVENFDKSLVNVKKSIKKHLHCVSFEMLFKWAYVMVNSRAVYVDPHFVWNINNSLRDIILDEPSQALCPFLDMFNHHFHANTEAYLIEGTEVSFVYVLKSGSSYKAYEQFMISYGPHNNDTLLMQYGFFIPENVFDTVKYTFQEVKDLISFNLPSNKYRFIKDHMFDSELYIGHSGVSFNLKALLYVIFNDELRNFNAAIFGDAYPEQFSETIVDCCGILLISKLKCYEEDFQRFVKQFKSNRQNELMESYLRYKIRFVKNLIKKFA